MAGRGLQFRMKGESCFVLAKKLPDLTCSHLSLTQAPHTRFKEGSKHRPAQSTQQLATSSIVGEGVQQAHTMPTIGCNHWSLTNDFFPHVPPTITS